MKTIGIVFVAERAEMRSWKCRITAPLYPIEIASEVHKSGLG
jgi:hypothetical protein